MDKNLIGKIWLPIHLSGFSCFAPATSWLSWCASKVATNTTHSVTQSLHQAIALRAGRTNSNQYQLPRSLKMKHTLLLFRILFAIASFNASAQYKDSLKTFRKLTKSYQKTSDYVFIPSGAYQRGDNGEDVPRRGVSGYYLRAHTVSIDSFFMGKFEISNANYMEFVNDKIKENTTLGKSFLPDTLVWRRPEGWGEKYTDYYFRHPAYQNSPVVGVSYTQAKGYAEWLTEQYNKNEDRIFKQVRFRIPTEEEWEYAYKGGLSNPCLPWGSYSTINHEGKPRANFRVVSQLSVYRDSAIIEYNGVTKKRPVYLSNGMREWDNIAGNLNYADVTQPVNALSPNGYGLYHIAGNLKEMVDAYPFEEFKDVLFTAADYTKNDRTWGVTKGGGWNDTGYYLQYMVRQHYTDEHSADAETGFRLVMEVLDF